MNILLLTIFSLASSFFVKANMDCVWISHKAGITISFIAPCDFANQSTVDSVLKIIISQLNRKDTSLKVLVLVNHGRLSFPDDDYANFFSIGFDTLREIDDDYIFDYNWNQERISMGPNGGLNTFRSENVPLDINSTSVKNAIRAIGIKIIYDIDYRLGTPIWNDLIKATVFATKNSGFIKTEQRRDTVRYNTNGWYVSLSTVDTFAINNIIGRLSESKKKETAQETPRTKNNYWLLGLFGLLTIGVIIYIVRKYSR